MILLEQFLEIKQLNKLMQSFNIVS